MPKKHGKNDVKDEYGLTRQQRVFAEHYALTGNKAASAIKAGSTPVSAGVTANRWLRNVMVKQFLDNRSKKHADFLGEKFDITAQRVLQEMAAIAFFDPGKLYDENGQLLPLNKMDEFTRRAVSGVDVKELTDSDGALIGYTSKVKPVSKVAALELLGRHLGMWGEKDSGGLSILNINIVTDQNQLDNPPQPKVIEHEKNTTIF